MRGLGLKIGDGVLMAGILVMAVLLFLLPLLASPASFAELVTADGGISVIDLEKDTVFDITSRDITLTLCVRNGELFVSHSTCRDSVCRNTPPISRAGQSIVCAPAGVVIRIIGEGAEVDGATG